MQNKRDFHIQCTVKFYPECVRRFDERQLCNNATSLLDSISWRKNDRSRFTTSCWCDDVYIQIITVARISHYSGHRVDLASGDGGKVVFQVLRTTPIMLAALTYKRDRYSDGIILQLLCGTRTRLSNYGHSLRGGNKRFVRKYGKYTRVRMTFGYFYFCPPRESRTLWRVKKTALSTREISKYGFSVRSTRCQFSTFLFFSKMYHHHTNTAMITRVIFLDTEWLN